MFYNKPKYTVLALAVAALALMISPVWAGPVIIDGTDSNDHGDNNGGVSNDDGWLYMQKALENLAGQVAASVTKVVVDLGTEPSSGARDAIDSAFSLSSLPGDGWTITHVNGTTAIDDHLASLSTTNTGILYIPTAGNVSGDVDLTNAELDVINGRAAEIAAYVGGAGDPTQGGALFSQGESPDSPTVPYGWLTSIIPGIGIVDVTSSGIDTDLSLTTEGEEAFPGLTNADLSSGPWHNYFTPDPINGFGSLQVLATAPEFSFGTPDDVPIILGGGAATTISTCPPGTQPDPQDPDSCIPIPSVIPEPGTVFLLAVGLGSIGLATLRRRKKA
jgi:hypothetical protein